MVLNQLNNIDIDIENAWNISTGSPSIKIGILDSGSDWVHEDLGKGTDSYQNIYLNPGEDAWLNSINPLTGNGIDDDGNGLIDDWKGYNFDLNTNDSRGTYFHGTHVAGIVGAKTNNNKGVSGIAGGWNSKGCELIICNIGQNAPNGSVLDDAILYAINHGAKIIQLSLSVIESNDINAAIQYANDNGVIVVCSSGNSGGNLGYPASNSLVFSVGATNQNDLKASFSNFGNNLDISAPGTSIRSTRINNNYDNGDGTSFASPIVSGVAGLMLSVNSCLKTEQIKDIIQKTADKVGPYNYNWNSNLPGHSIELGYGRINAYKAVLAAQNMNSSQLDLYIRDTYNDIGYNAGYQFTWDFDDSPDIWVRNQNDGLSNQIHENPEYQASAPVYVYVKVGNKSCLPSTGNEKLALYWSKASSNNSWPQNWDGTNPTVGNMIDNINIPVLQPGESTILTFTWNIAPNTGIGTTWNNCLLARIENSSIDIITVHPNDLGQDVYQNNNVSMRNCVVTNYIPGIAPPVSGNVYVKERFFNIGNPHETANNYDIIFRNQEDTINLLTQVAEINVQLDQQGWDLLSDKLQNRGDIKIKDNFTFTIVGNAPVVLSNINFPENTMLPVLITVNFLTDEVNEINSYKYHVLQKFNEPLVSIGDHWTGGVHFTINKGPRDLFNAEAGADIEIDKGTGVTITAAQINEAAKYNWYDSDGNLIYSGPNLYVSPEITNTYKLEVVADADGFKDYDEVEVSVNRFKITNLSPNPAVSTVNIEYEIEGANSAYLMIIGVTNYSASNNYLLDLEQTQRSINLTNYTSGLYSVSLIVDGQIVDAIEMLVE